MQCNVMCVTIYVCVYAFLATSLPNCILSNFQVWAKPVRLPFKHLSRTQSSDFFSFNAFETPRLALKTGSKTIWMCDNTVVYGCLTIVMFKDGGSCLLGTCAWKNNLDCQWWLVTVGRNGVQVSSEAQLRIWGVWGSQKPSGTVESRGDSAAELT